MSYSISELYGKYNLAEWDLFKGGFINFGFWSDEVMNQSSSFTDQDREESSRRLYEKIFDLLDIRDGQTILEVGCGQGKGACLLANRGVTVYGLDASLEQINRCFDQRREDVKDRLQFFCSSAEKLPFPNRSIDRVFSLEALQHFDSFLKFLKEAYRTLFFGGKLVIATFLFKKFPSLIDLKEMPTFTNGIDHVILIEDLRQSLEKTGFHNITISSIGENIWAGFDRWISQTTYAKTWNRKWFQLYKEEVVDYYTVEAFL